MIIKEAELDEIKKDLEKVELVRELEADVATLTTETNKKQSEIEKLKNEIKQLREDGYGVDQRLVDKNKINEEELHKMRRELKTT